MKKNKPSPTYQILSSKLSTAIKENDFISVKNLWDENSLKTLESFNGYIFKVGIKTGNLDMIKFFIEKGVKINCGAGSVLDYAAEISQVKILDYLIKSGGEIHFNNDIVFQESARRRDEKVIEYLLTQNVDMYANESQPMKYAVVYQDLKIVEMYVNNGYNKKEILEIASVKNAEKIIKYIKTCLLKDKLSEDLTEKTNKSKVKKI